ncbi:MAG TPA: hypothetical protein VFS39_07600 [Nitrospira sp.]|nr:hypothetical protein [Nitrospira sp.]
MRPPQDKDIEYRRALLRLAAKGNVRASRELAEEYHARLYSPAERAKYIPMGTGYQLPGSVQRKIDAMLYEEP